MTYDENLISIVMPCYNSQDYIGEAIDSVQKQTYPNWELVICDDCSKDNSVEVVKKIAETDPRIILVVSEANGGTAAARNKALDKAKGRYVVFLDSDDTWDPTFLEKQLNFLRSNNYAIVTASYNRIAPNSNTVFIVPEINTYKSILKGNPISCLTTMYDRSITGDRRFDESLRKCEDYVFWLNIMKEDINAYGNQEVLANYRILANSKSRNKLKLIKHMWTVYHRTQKLNVFKSFYYLCCWALYGRKKYKNVR